MAKKKSGGSLNQFVRAHLTKRVQEQPRKIAEIAREFGVARTWLLAYTCKAVLSPSVDLIERIYTQITGKTIL